LTKSGTDTDFPKSVSVPVFGLDVERARASSRCLLVAHDLVILNTFKNAATFCRCGDLSLPN